MTAIYATQAEIMECERVHQRLIASSFPLLIGTSEWRHAARDAAIAKRWLICARAGKPLPKPLAQLCQFSEVAP